MFKTVVAAMVLLASPAYAHSWYAKECCDNRDCAPILEKHRNGAGDWVVTTKIGTTTFSSKIVIKPSQDEEDHACMIPPFGPGQSPMPLCLYFRVEM